MSAQESNANHTNDENRPTSRRLMMQSAAGVAAGLYASFATGSKVLGAEPATEAKQALKGNIKQSLVHWCYRPHWSDFRELCQVAKDLGCVSIELTDPANWATLKEFGLTCAIAGSHGFQKGPNHKENWDMCREVLLTRIDECADFGVKSVITFTGMADGISPEEGAKNCIAFFKELMPVAEKKKVTLCLEMLNTRDDTHRMKGHPGYQGDHTEYCIDICKAVGSERMKLLFDIYHVQIMDGDVIRRIRQHQDYLGHIHTAGNPGRAELDDDQEINYPAVMKALLEVKYDGFVGQEYIPTREPLAGLRQAVALCDV